MTTLQYGEEMVRHLPAHYRDYRVHGCCFGQEHVSTSHRWYLLIWMRLNRVLAHCSYRL